MNTKDLFLTKDISRMLAETHVEGESLKRSIGAFGLTALGVGAIIGTGIFVVIGEGANLAGPALVISFILAAVTCAFPPCRTPSWPPACPSPAAPTRSPTPPWR